MSVPKLFIKIFGDLDEREIEDTIFMYYKTYASNPALLNQMIKTYINVIVNDRLEKWNAIRYFH